jgi:hypothetical protein
MNCTSDAYAVWLRSLLQDTNGVFVEWRERSSPTQISGTAADVVARGEDNVQAMRAYNAAQVRYDGGPGMLNNPPPPVQFTLSASSDWLRWAAPVPDPANPTAPDPEIGQTMAAPVMSR